MKKLPAISLSARSCSAARAIEAVPLGEQDGDGKQRRCPSRWIVGVVPVVDGEAQPASAKKMLKTAATASDATVTYAPRENRSRPPV